MYCLCRLPPDCPPAGWPPPAPLTRIAEKKDLISKNFLSMSFSRLAVVAVIEQCMGNRICDDCLVVCRELESLFLFVPLLLLLPCFSIFHSSKRHTLMGKLIWKQISILFHHFRIKFPLGGCQVDVVFHKDPKKERELGKAWGASLSPPPFVWCHQLLCCLYYVVVHWQCDEKGERSLEQPRALSSSLWCSSLLLISNFSPIRLKLKFLSTWKLPLTWKWPEWAVDGTCSLI